MCCPVSGLNALLDAELGGLSLCTGALTAALHVAVLDSGEKEEHGPPATPGHRPSSLKLKAAKRWLGWYCCSAGGDNISVTKGVVSRVEPTQYAHGATQLMAIQISLLMGSRKGNLFFNTDEQ